MPIPMHPAPAPRIAKSFALQPLTPIEATAICLTGHVLRRHGLLEAEFRVAGDLAALAIPSPAARPRRRHGLWRQTCFELFFGEAGSAGYLEVNFSPAGHWNFYRFSSYRSDMREEPGSEIPRGQVRRDAALLVRLGIDLAGIGLEGRQLQVRPCAVLLSREGAPSYWALSHPGPRPDFHDPGARHLPL